MAGLFFQICLSRLTYARSARPDSPPLVNFFSRRMAGPVGEQIDKTYMREVS